MPWNERWNPDVDEHPDEPQDDTVIKRRPDGDEEEEDIPPHPGAPFGIPGGRRRRRENRPTPVYMGGHGHETPLLDAVKAPSAPGSRRPNISTQSGWLY